MDGGKWAAEAELERGTQRGSDNDDDGRENKECACSSNQIVVLYYYASDFFVPFNPDHWFYFCHMTHF